MPEISVIIPVYNAEKYLAETIESVLNQTFLNFEVIAVNDGSKDASLSILNSYAKKDERICVIDKPNSGVSDTRNLGFSKAKGKYCCFIDADDILAQDYLETMYNIAKNKNADMVVCGYEPFRGSFNPKKGGTVKRVENTAELLESGIMTSAWTKLIKKEVIEKYNIKFKKGMTFGEDLFFCWKAYFASNAVFQTNAVLYGYRMTETGATSRFHAGLYESYKAAFEDLKLFYKTNFNRNADEILEIDMFFTKRLPSFMKMAAREKTKISVKLKNVKKTVNDDVMEMILNEYWKKLTEKMPQKRKKKYLYARNKQCIRLLFWGYMLNARDKAAVLKSKIFSWRMKGEKK